MLFDDYEWPTKDTPGSWPHSPASFDSPDHPKLGIDRFLDTMGAELQVGVDKLCYVCVFIKGAIAMAYRTNVRKIPSAQEEPRHREEHEAV